MRTHRGGERVAPGIYCSLSSGELLQRSLQDPALPGSIDTRYVRIPRFMVLVLGPLAGLAFVVFMPLAGIIGLLVFGAHKIAPRVSRTVRKAALSRWLHVPGMAHRSHRQRI